ncbi:SPFH domain-containing protein [Promineifilum sp.]|uniref:SPFH domain-containing protein n=1 Tax=Promineifilum sp. TaxID=2664178 RepID=UPI0035AE9605
MTVPTQPRAARRRVPRLKFPESTNWPLLVLIIVLIGYWFFARSLERIDGRVILAAVFLPGLPVSQIAETSFSPLITLLVELFHPLVLRHLIPVLVGWWLAVEAAVSLVQVLYDCPDRKTAAEFLKRQRRNTVGATELPYAVSPKTLDEMRRESMVVRVGGPMLVTLPEGHAAVTERNGRFLRVLPPGGSRLERFEYVQSVIDLRTQTSKKENVALLTKEGIELKTDVALTFKLDHGEEPVTKLRPYPFRPELVKRVAYAGTVGPNGKASSWEGGPIGKVVGTLSGLVSGYPLDELISPDSPVEAHRLLVQKVTDGVWSGLEKDGVKPLRMHIGRLTPPKAVSQQHSAYWTAKQLRAEQLTRVNGTVQLLQEAETARADAELLMIQAMVEGVRRAQQEVGEDLSGYLLAVRLLEALRQMFQSATAGLKSAGGDETVRLALEMEAFSERLSGLEDDLKRPTVQFRPSRPD